MSQETAKQSRKKPTKAALVRRVIIVFTLWALFGLAVRTAITTFAAAPASQTFTRTWQRTDQPVSTGQVDRTWMWGPEGFTAAMTEPYLDAPGGQRMVQYFDKSRMEDNAYRATAPWDVANGLLVVELISGRLQVGDEDFAQHAPAQVNVAGDQGVPGVTYAELASLLSAPAAPDGATLTARLDANGTVSDAPSLAGYGVTAAYRVTVPGIDHQVASPFWAFMNASGLVYEAGGYGTAALFESPFYATGYPLTEAYWSTVTVGGVAQDVLLQCFERRCLTYTPGNPEGWQVEAGNVGQHYYQWRYEQIDDDPTASPPTPTEPDDGAPPASPTPTEPGDDPVQTPEAAFSYLGQWGSPIDENTEFREPSAVAVGPDGSIYVTEYDNFRVQKFSPRGVLLASWGDEQSLGIPEAVAVDDDGNVYVAADDGPVLKFDGNGRYLGEIGRPADFLYPASIAFDSLGNIYVLDTDAGQILKFDPSGTLIDRLASAGSGPEQIDRPRALAIDNQDVIYVTDSFNARVQKYATDGTHLGGWEGNPTPFVSPYGIVVSDSGIVYVSDGAADRIFAYDTNGTFLGSVGATGSDPLEFQAPQHLALDRQGNLFVADMLNNRIQKLGPTGVFLDAWGDGHRGRISDFAMAMTIDGNGNVFIADFRINRMQVFGPDGEFRRMMDEHTTDLYLESVRDITIGPDGYLYIARSDSGNIAKYERDGTHVIDWYNGVVEPMGIAVHQNGNIYVTDIYDHQVKVFDQSGALIDSWGGPGDGDGQFNQPHGIAIYQDTVYVVDRENHRIQYFDLSGNYLGQWGGAGSDPGEFAHPFGITVYDGYVFITDFLNHRVQVFTASGEYLDHFGTFGSDDGEFDAATRIAVHEGIVYVLDTLNNRVQTFSSPAALR